ncbi:MAG: SpoIIE family protein phosphatase [Flavobacteriales bacterium]|nr:SpoIIE family protein phosphatase [Flavobacteriales bacterium]
MNVSSYVLAFFLVARAASVVAQEDHLADMLHALPGRERADRLIVLAADERQHGDFTESMELATLAGTEAMAHGLNNKYAEAMLELSSAQQAKGLLEEAIGSAVRAGMTTEDDDAEVHAKAMRRLGELYLAAGEPHEALASLAAAGRAVDATTRTQQLGTEVYAQAMILDDPALIDYLNGVLKEFEHIGAPVLKYQVLTLLADAQGAAGNLDQALGTEEKVSFVALSLGRAREAAISANNQIVLAQRIGQHDRALAIYNKGLGMVTDFADLRVSMHANAALTYAAKGDHEQALTLAKLAVREAERQDAASLSSALRTMSAVLVTNGDLGEAQNAAADALKAAEANKDSDGQLAACDLLSWILDRRNLTTEARTYDRRIRELEQQRSETLKADADHRRERSYRLQHIEMEEVGRLNREAEQQARMTELSLGAANSEKQLKLLQYERELDESARREAVSARERADQAVALAHAKLQAERNDRVLGEMDSERKIQSLSLTKMEMEKHEKQRAIELLEQRGATAEAERQKERHMRTFSLLLALGAAVTAVWMTWAWIVTRRKKRTIWNQHQEIKHINEKLEDREKDINSSLRYARTIQEAILPSESDLRACIQESFILYKPLDVVSGDLPFVRRIGDKVFVAAIDCTGHGVPAAMMTFIAYYGLSELLQQDPDAAPGHILDGLHEHVRRTMETREKGALYNDGFDIGLCVIDLEHGALSFSGAQLPLFVVRDGAVRRLKGDILPIGDDTFDHKAGYRTETVQLQDQDHLYLSSDGLIHQFGGERQRTFSTKRLQELLSATGGMSMQEVKTRTDEMFQQWKGNNAQTDDLLLIGMRYAA